MSEPAEVAIIGGGIVGVTAAYWLARRGVPVTLLEKGRIAGEQSSRNWGFVRQQGRDPAEVPLMMACNRIWQGLEAELGEDLEWTMAGNLRVATDEKTLADYERWMEVARDNALETEMLTRREVEDRLPGFHGRCLGGMWTGSDGHAEPALVAPAFARAARRLGARIHTDEAVTEIIVGGGRVEGVLTEHREVRANAVICGAGAWSRRLLRQVGLRFPQLWMRGSVARLAPVRRITDAGVWSDCAFRQRRDGSVNIAWGHGGHHDVVADSFTFLKDFWSSFMGHGEKLRLAVGRPLVDDLRGRHDDFRRNRILDPAPDAATLGQALDAFRSSFPNTGPLRVERTWAGYIDLTPDMVPVIDRVGEPAGLIVASGLSGHGFGLGPIVGQCAAALSLGEAPGFDLAPFRFSRFVDGSSLVTRSAI